MRVTLLGTGSPLPDAHRAGPATLVQAGGLNLLFDCGRGVLMRLAGAGLPTPAFLHGLFLTHQHSDHVTDLNDVLTTRWATSMVPAPLPMVGPTGTSGLAERTLEMLQVDVGYRLAHHEDLTWEPSVEVLEVDEGEVELPVLSDAGVRVLVGPTDHRPVAPTVGYRVEHDGHSAVLAGDTVPCDSLDALVAGADVYVQTVIREDLIRQIPVPRLQDVCDYHSTVQDAARTAAKGGVGTLVLTHMVPVPASPEQVQEWIALAAEEFSGTILAPDDLGAIDVGG
jgi:ribonuclease Z